MLTFQQIITRLTQFWEKKGCIIHQGHDLEVGAGTFNPATFLRCLGPEPYNTAYVEPSRRPADGRYGENPNRVQLFHQFQVILKPSPKDVQKLCLQSLEAMGLNLKEHDIRFVHDDWEGPTLGAWGLGWEVWCDGMEVCQFTYFQAVGSLPLNPVSAEITYGLERLALFIQNVSSIFDVQWNEHLTIGEISKQNEVEWSAYNFTHASTEMWLKHFEDFEKEAKRLITAHLPLPAYDFVIKASHAFNMLEARGVISVTERTGYIGRIRELARLIAVEYLASREKQGFPLLKKDILKQKKPLPKAKASFKADQRADFLLEIGSEELPASFVPIGCAQLEKKVRMLLDSHKLSFQNLRTFGTPRRLAILVEGLMEGSSKETLQKRGPSVAAAFTPEGILSPQGEGFFKSCNLPPCALSRVRKGKVKGLDIETFKDQEYLVATLVKPGKATFVLLAEELGSLILNLDFPKKMRWGNEEISYPRPLRWIVALWGNKIIPFEIGSIRSHRISYGHAQRDPSKIAIPSPQSYVSLLKEHFVLADVEERKHVILQQLKELEETHHFQSVKQEKVLSEVLHLTEWPELLIGSFKPLFLKVPKEVLICEMVEHQKYFPVENAQGELLPQFVIVADNVPSNKIREGNEKVLSARLSDGVFLYEQDAKVPLETWNEKLSAMIFQKELGSMGDKVLRIVSHAETLNRFLSLADDKKLRRAALLCKADLASTLVREFPELQGILGKYYALAQKESSDVAEALAEHWMPKAEGAPLPQTSLGVVLSLADKIDNLLGYFSIGLKPSSSSDPYALRRQTLGMLRILVEGKLSLNLQTLLAACASSFPKAPSIPIPEILSFVTHRAKTVFEELGYKKEEIEACMQGLCVDPYDLLCKLQALHAFKARSDAFSKLAEVYKRAKGQLKQGTPASFNKALLLEPAEKTLWHSLEEIEKHWKDTLSEKNYAQAFHLIASLQEPLAKLFDTVKILSDDLTVRANRLALLQKVFSYFEQLLDLGSL